MREPLNEAQIRDALSTLPGWNYGSERLQKTFEFGDFREAIGFIVRIAFCAEALNHHPELTNVYNRVSISLTTHDAGNRVTELDVKLATAIENVLGGSL